MTSNTVQRADLICGEVRKHERELNTLSRDAYFGASDQSI
jgi:hypothetical protein